MDNSVAGDWIKYHRKTEESAVFQDAELFRFWMWVLSHANWRRNQLVDGTVLEPGQLIMGTENTAEKLGVGRQTIRRCLKQLEKLGNATTKPTTRGTIVTIVNWRTYQDEKTASNQTSNQEPTRSQPGANHSRRREEGKEGEEERRGCASCPASKSEARPPDTILEFPVRGPGRGKPGDPGKVWHLTQPQVDEWTEAYAPLPVAAECRKALTWVKAASGRVKTPGGMPKFLVGWLNRAANSGNNHPTTAAKPAWLVEKEARWERGMSHLGDKA